MKKSEIQKSLVLAEQYFRANNYQLAQPILKEILDIDSKNSKANELLSYIYGNQRRLDLSFQLLKLACNQYDCSPEALYYLGSIQLEMSLYDEAIRSLKKSILKAGEYFEAIHDLATAYAHLGETKTALNYYQKCLTFRQQSYELFYNIGRSLDDLKRYEEALASYVKAIELKPEFAEAWDNRGVTLNELKRYDEALTHFDKAIELKPEMAEAWSNKGLTLNNLMHHDEALAHCNKAIELKPESAVFWSNKGFVLKSMNRHDEALTHYDKAIELRPDFIDPYYSKALTNLVMGNFEQGWDLHEYRWKRKDAETYRYSTISELTSLKNLQDKKILVWHEQGYGDTIQFARYVPLLTNLGAQVTFEVQKPLLKLFDKQFDCSVTASVRKSAQFDCQIPLLSLLKLFKTNITNIPSIPKLTVNRSKIIFWKEKLELSNRQLNIGLATSGNPKHKNDHNRSMLLKNIEPLLAKGKFFLIQKELKIEDQIFLDQHPEIIHLGDKISDFVDTAAIIHNLDLIISVDTSLIHLSGSLNKKSFLMSTCAAEWRWLIDRADTPWYSSVQIIRQKSSGDWESVIKEMDIQIQNQ